MNFKEAFSLFIPRIEEEMRQAMTGLRPPGDQSAEQETFYGMMNYHLGWADENFQPLQVNSGKRLRPLFALLACQSAGGDPNRALPAAAAVELIHNFTLIHDDIEDRSLTRRGRRAVWAIWGDALGINTGDTMFTLARHALLRLAELNIPHKTILQAIRKLDDTCLTLCYGQHLDISFEDRLDVDMETYLTMIRGKTAALLGCAGYLGALIAADDEQVADRYGRLGEEMGLAFQIQDDILGIWGEETTTGKPAADDIRRRKKSLPVVYVLSHAANPTEANRLRRLYQRQTLTEDDVAAALAILERTEARSHVEQAARHHIDAALRILDELLAAGSDGQALREMAEFFIQREH
ncbi:MAG: polyprenyl synthetase family protein [Anaerolineae bacterium]